MGSNFDYGWSDINQAFAAGNVGMYISGSDVYTNLVQASNINPAIYGLATIPLAKSKTAGVLGGGTLAAVRPTRNAAQKAAAVKWIDFFYERPLDLDKQQAIANAKTLVAEQAAGRSAGAADLQQGAVRPRQHLDQAVRQRAASSQMKPFTTGHLRPARSSRSRRPRPRACTTRSTRSCEAVLTNKNANIRADAAAGEQHCSDGDLEQELIEARWAASLAVVDPTPR